MSGLQDVYNQKSYQYLFEVETLAQDILTDKETKLDLSNSRNKFREALRALEHTEDRRTWMQMGSVYIERPTEECKAILKTGIWDSCKQKQIVNVPVLEMENADIDIAELDNSIKKKLHKLRDLEHEPRLEGFTLNPISASEAKALHKGHVDPGETEMVTALRETAEESGLKKEDLKIHEEAKKILNYKVNGKPKVVTYWLAELINPKAEVKLSDEHQDFKWLNLHDACVYGKYPEMQELLKYCDSYIRSK
ncbi:p53 and DNA damage-regulated protein 1 [Asbolus verrucosus]|uniref:Bis(5'-nucleosyl)-tetraphosphatase [asymmetrical] n=1 Tax=Asbolus verrucosus TaxID=1661398 RepID=A0A482VYZ6_ASBVE|nr:p53 and DNA damage-regulated protein 1 [Asbolus verrucosus]